MFHLECTIKYVLVVKGFLHAHYDQHKISIKLIKLFSLGCIRVINGNGFKGLTCIAFSKGFKLLPIYNNIALTLVIKFTILKYTYHKLIIKSIRNHIHQIHNYIA